jgi:hypothetical protein
VITSDLRNSGQTKVRTPVYYPGVRSKKNATIIQFGRAEKRTHTDFGIPVEDVPEPRGHPCRNQAITLIDVWPESM